MKWSFATIGVILLGVIGVSIIFLFQSITTSNENDYYLLKEITEAAMIDAIDIPYYRETGDLKIVREKFVENFTRRYAESTIFVSNKYNIMFYDIMETPPKVSIIIDTGLGQFTVGGNTDEYGIKNKLDGILEYVGKDTFSSSPMENPLTIDNNFVKVYYAMSENSGATTTYSLKIPGELIAPNIKNVRIGSVSDIGKVTNQGEINEALLNREILFNVEENTDYMQFINDFDTNVSVSSTTIYNCDVDGVGTTEFVCDDINKYWISFNVRSDDTTKSKSIFKYKVTWVYDLYKFSE